MKKILKLDFLVFALVTLLLWMLSTFFVIHKGKDFKAVFSHHYIDQHTLQALAWQKGRLDLDYMYGGLELARYKGKIYNSFPASPTLIEFPFTLIFGRETPNTFIQLIFVWIAMLMGFFILEKYTGNRLLSFIISFSFFWGSNIYYLSLTGPVWHQGHMYGIFFAMTALLILVYAQRPFQLAFGAFFLGLCVGCRPFYFLYIPFYLYLGFKKFPVSQTLLWTFIGLIPPGLYTGVLNMVRFGSPTTFGHIHLEYSKMVDFDVFGFKYLGRNLFHTFLKLPEWNSRSHSLDFHGRGNMVFLISPAIFTSLVTFFKKDVELSDKLMGGLTILTIWFMLLLHCGNGWYQFGYRYIVDIIPVFLIVFAWGFKKLPVWIYPVLVFSVLINIYGAIWFYNPGMIRF